MEGRFSGEFPGRRLGSGPLGPEDVDTARFRRQWVICSVGDDPGRAWRRVRLDPGHVLHLHPDARFIEANPVDSRRIVVGVALYPGGLAALHADLDSSSDMVTVLQHLAGTYVAIEATEDVTTIYTDPAGMMGVYEGLGRVASTPALLGNLERDSDLDRAYRFGGTDDWYPGDLTPFVGVRALLANHTLRLPGGARQRFWPKDEPPELSAEAGLDRLASLVRQNVLAACELGPVVCSLTGGRDTRVNLAALRDRRDEVRFFTVQGDATPSCDVALPRELAARHGLNYELLAWRAPPGWLVELYDEMTSGLSIGGRRTQIGAVKELSGPSVLHLNGNLGGMGKGFYWHVRKPRRVRRRTLAKEFVQRPEQLRHALASWHETVPDLRPTTVYNLMYLEQRGGRWIAPGEAASNLFYDSVTPHCSRQVFDAFSGMPIASQLGAGMSVDLIRRLWPELLDVDFCRRRRSVSAYVPRAVKSRIKAFLG